MCYTKAQRDVLELLSVVGRLADELNLKYSLFGRQSLCCLAQDLDFDRMNPNDIRIVLPYKDYLALVGEIRCRAESLGVVLVSSFSHQNFDYIGSWLCKPNRVQLPETRKSDEIYYYAHLSLLPILPAGDTLKEAEKYVNDLRGHLSVINSRMPQPQKRTFSKLKSKLGRVRQRRLVRERRKSGLDMRDLFSYINKRLGERKYLFVDFKIISAEVVSDTEEVSFFGVKTKVFSNYKDLVENLYKKLPDRPVSELLLRGGEDLRRVQLIQLDILLEFDRICRKYDIKYNIAFGTLLGALRHKGFVPWDDDVDVNMPVEEYLRFREIVKTDLNKNKFYFRDQTIEEDCNITYAHLKMNGTVYTKKGRSRFKYHPGVFLDIVPLFNGAPWFWLHWLHTRICWFFRTACWAYVGADSEKKPGKRRYYQRLAMIGNKRAYKWFWRFATLFPKSDRMAFFNGMDRSPYNVGFVKRVGYDKMIEMEFEGYKFFGPSNYEESIWYAYGEDWSMYPPVAKRLPKNNVLIKLNGLHAYDGECFVDGRD